MGQRLLSATDKEWWVCTKDVVFCHSGDNVDIVSQIYKRGV